MDLLGISYSTALGV